MSVPRIYLDTCSLNRPFDNQEQMKIHLETEAKLYIQRGVREGRYSLVWSFMLDYENDRNPYEEKRNVIAPWKVVADDFCPPSETVRSRGRVFEMFGIKHGDALHIACAVEKNCGYFITTDKQLFGKKIPDIKIINPIDFVREVEV